MFLHFLNVFTFSKGNVYIGKYPGLNVAQNASGFIGKLSRLHLWDRVLLGEEIEEMAKRPNDYAGNVIDWYKFAEYIIGDVKIIKPSTAVDTGLKNIKKFSPLPFLFTFVVILHLLTIK